MRFRTDGSGRDPDFVLNKPAYRKAEILMAGANFGCGSSREHAPWALLDFGIKCVIAQSFADIFYNNCFQNGVLPIKLPAETVALLTDDAQKGANARLTIDLQKQTITPAPTARPCRSTSIRSASIVSLNGLDDIGITLQKERRSRRSRLRRRAQEPWA